MVTLLCSAVIAGVVTPRPVVVAGAVAVPRHRFYAQVEPVEEGSLRWWRKDGLVVRAGTSVVLTVPRGAGITWGQSGIVRTLRVPACPGKTPWIVFAGGFYVERKSCVPLTIRANGETRTVRFGIGRRCR